MFARTLEFNFKPEYKHELMKKIREDVLPTLRKQPGFFDVLWLQCENESKEFFAIVWTTKADAERYHKEYFAKVKYMLEPYLATPLSAKWYNVDLTFSEAFVEAFVA